MYKLTLAVTACCIFITVVSGHYRERRSGISDQRLAEIQTLLALANHGNGEYAHGIVDPSLIGKRKRSYNYDQLEDDFPLDFLRESKVKFPSSRRDALAYLRRLPERMMFLQENELENQDMQSDDMTK